MTRLRFIAMTTQQAQAYRDGDPNANGQSPEIAIASGSANPCRHCLEEIAAGDDMLILAHRPFPEAQPYAELAPVFIHAGACERYGDEDYPPAMLKQRPQLLIRGYKADNRIKYGTGEVVATDDFLAPCTAKFDDPEIAFVHVRSATNNCFICRIEKA